MAYEYPNRIGFADFARTYFKGPAVVTRETPRLRERYGKDAVFVTPRQYQEAIKAFNAQIPLRP